jgi:hypothetical protein
MKRFFVLAATAAIILSPVESPAFAQFGTTPDGVESAFGEEPEAVSLDSDFLIGRWTDDDNCSDAVEFAADGVFHTPDGSIGHWSLTGDRLTVTGAGTLTMQIVPVDDDTINVINAQGGEGRSIRCESDDDSIGDIPMIAT